MAVTFYRSSEPLNLRLSESVKLQNQVIAFGTDPEMIVSKGVFILEFLQTDTTGVVLKDGLGVEMSDSGLTGVDQGQSAIRCNYGFKIVGNVIMLKGFVVDNCLS